MHRLLDWKFHLEPEILNELKLPVDTSRMDQTADSFKYTGFQTAHANAMAFASLNFI